jgi:hypothetical protein
MLIKVKAFPGEKEEEIIKKSEDSFDVKVRERPIMGQANRGIIRALSFYFEVPESNIKLIKGFKERNKIFEIIKN